MAKIEMLKFLESELNHRLEQSMKDYEKEEGVAKTFDGGCVSAYSYALGLVMGLLTIEEELK